MVYFRQNPHQTTNDRNREKNRRVVEQKNITQYDLCPQASTATTTKGLYIIVQLPKKNANKAQRSPETPAAPPKEE